MVSFDNEDRSKCASTKFAVLVLRHERNNMPRDSFYRRYWTSLGHAWCKCPSSFVTAVPPQV